MMRYIKILLFLLYGSASQLSLCQVDLIPAMTGLGNLNYFNLTNTNSDQKYYIIAKKPNGYSDTIGYPIIYLLDGGITLPLLASYSTYLSFDHETPPHILVGISYGTNLLGEGNNRGHDYTTPSDQREYYGGA